MLRLHGLPAKCIAFAVHQLVIGKDCWSEHNCFGMSERTFLRLLCDLQRLAHPPPRQSCFLPTLQIGFVPLWSITAVMQCAGPWGTTTSFLQALSQRWYKRGWIGFPRDVLILKWSYLLLGT